MFGMFETFASCVSAQAKEYAALQDNVRQRAVSALLDPFQILQPARATVQTSNAKRIDPPGVPAERAARAKGPSASQSPTRRPKRPALNFA